MALSNWTIHKSNADNIECGISTIAPLVSTGSLRIKDNDATKLNMFNTSYTPGLIRGRMRMLICIMAQGGIGVYRTGFYFQSSHANLVVGSDQTFYSAHVLLSPSVSTRQYAFAHYTGGMDGTETILYTSPVIPSMINGTTVLPLEVEWRTETELDGVHVTLRGDESGGQTLTDFTNLATLSTFIITHPLQKIMTSVGEGIYYYGASSPGGSEIKYDQVSVFSLAPV